jgi:hypothetical protein
MSLHPTKLLSKEQPAAKGARATTRRPRAGSAPRHGGRTPFVLLILGLLGGGLVLLLGLNTVSAANELRRHDFASRDQSIAASLVELRNAVAASAAPQNLARHAAEYGMVPAGAPAFLVVGASGTVRVLGSAAPASAIPLPVSSPAHKTKHPAKKDARKNPKTKRTDPKAAAKQTESKTAAPTRSTSPTPSRPRPGSTRTSTSAAAHPSTSTPSTSTPPPKPSTTPVPTITLPGGTR